MRIDIAKEFASCVRQLGGTVLDDELDQPDFANADYWFSDPGVVAELKCLSENPLDRTGFNNQVESMYDSWVAWGLVPPVKGSRIQLDLRSMPNECARQFVDLIKRKLENSTLKKANRQIRATKEYLGVPNAKGLLLLANDGNRLLPPNMAAHLLARSLIDQHSSISSVIYFSANDPVATPGVPMDSMFWIDGLVPGREPISSNLHRTLQTAWMRHYSGLVSSPVFELDGNPDPEYVDKIQFS